MTSRRSSTKTRKVSTLLVVTLLIGVFAFGTRLVLSFFAGPPDFEGPGSGSVSITVRSGDSLTTVGNTLKAAKVVASVDAFVEAASANPDSQSLQPGSYIMKREMKAAEALSLILSRDTRQSNAVTIREGLQAREIVSRFTKQSRLNRKQLESALRQTESLGLPPYAKGRVEGFLFPASYEVGENQSALQVWQTMVKTFRQKVAPLEIESGARSLNLSAYQIVTIASLVQAESHPRDYRKVARVVLNRLKEGMPLQFDSTVNYGLGKSHVILSTAQLQTDTPFNTYIHPGLPPTPINNPGLEAINAALHPANGDWLFFVTVNLKTQETKFSRSYSEFLRNKEEFLSWCRQNPGECSK